MAVWPKQPGWLHMKTQAQAQATGAVDGAVYVYADGDWPLWQRSQRRDATTRYAARTPDRLAGPVTRSLPSWPFGLLFGLAMLGL